MIIFFHPELYFLLFAVLLAWQWRNFSFWWKRGLLALGLVLLYLATTPFVPVRLAGQLENKHAVLDEKSLPANGRYNIVILGAGHHQHETRHVLSRLGNTGRARLAEGVRVAHAFPQSRVITSGYFALYEKTTAYEMKRAALSLGIDETRLHTQDSAVNTAAEARHYVAQFGVEDSLILVTSALHMPRAYAWFVAAGVQHIHTAPADFLYFSDDPFRWQHLVPNGEYLAVLRRWGKEVAGKWLVR